MIPNLLASSLLAAVVSGVVAFLISERGIAAENVIQERTKWRERVRDLAEQINQAIVTGADANRFHDLRDQLELRLNPHDRLDQELLALVSPAEDAYARERANEFNLHVALLLKHDWERAKWEASLLRMLFRRQPKRKKFQCFEPGDDSTYTRRRWSLFLFLVVLALALAAYRCFYH
jgi:hypothetical protein